jgi:hypothetical protein
MARDLPPPTLEELPDLKLAERKYPVRVGIVGQDSRVSRRRLVPPLDEVPLTELERQVLADEERRRPKPRDPDMLAFYRPEPGPAQGVSAEEWRLRTAVNGVAGGLIGTTAAQKAVIGSDDEGAASRGVYEVPISVPGLYPFSLPRYAIGPGQPIQVGEAPKRTVAGRHQRVDE